MVQYFDPFDSYDLALKMKVLLESPVERNRLANLSMERSKLYSWDIFTKHIIEACEKAIIR